MGLEALCDCRGDACSGQVKALLETHDLILRGAVKRTWPIAALAHVAVEGDDLALTVGGESLRLVLGAATAQRWAKKIATPPPTLAAKLGLAPDALIFVIGEVSDALLRGALDGHRAEKAQDAKASLAVVASERDLAAALARHRAHLVDRPIWLAYGKGARSPYGDRAVRAFMRGAGWIDTKVSGVSDALTATRYNKAAKA